MVMSDVGIMTAEMSMTSEPADLGPGHSAALGQGFKMSSGCYEEGNQLP